MPLFYYKEKRESNVKSNIFRRSRRDQLFSACVALFLSIKQQGGVMLILSRTSYVAFAAFGLFWGTWGALLPAFRSQASLTDAEFGTVLLFIGVGALPAMLLSGRAVDRWGVWVAGIMLIALAVAATIVGATAHNFVSTSISMLLLGVASGASDVAINSLAGLAEQQTGSRIITRSHGVFSLFVVIGSLTAGAARSVDLNPLTIFLCTAVVILILGTCVAWFAKTSNVTIDAGVRGGELPALGSFAPFLLIGLVGALAFAVENAHQSWGAVFLSDELSAPPGIAALAPATFAAFAATARFASSVARGLKPPLLLVGGSLIAATGTIIVAYSESVWSALVGVAIAATGTSVLFPTLLSIATKDVPAAQRGRATSAVGTIAYLGFLLGPAYVGLLASITTLRTALVGVALLALVYAFTCLPVTRRLRTHGSKQSGFKHPRG